MRLQPPKQPSRVVSSTRNRPHVVMPVPDLDKFIAFGDSHVRCFLPVIKNTHGFSASSAKGLGNPNSLSGTNNAIRELCKNPHDGYIFLFGKVDMDFLLTHTYNSKPNTDFHLYIEELVTKYIEFIQSLNLTNVYLCELPLSHLSDKDLLTINNLPNPHHNLQKHIDAGYTVKRYSKVLPLIRRQELILHFNGLLRYNAALNNFRVLEINKYFTPAMAVPNLYILPTLNHHLNERVGELYLRSLTLVNE